MTPPTPGLLDLPAPALDLLDSLLGFLPALARLLLWAAVGAAASMGVYALLSPQRRITAIKERLRGVRTQLAGYEGELQGAFPLLFLQVRLSFSQLLLTLGPALGAAIPALVLIVWIAPRYGYDSPAAGSPVPVRVVPRAAGFGWEPPVPADEPGSWTVPWPAEGRRLVLRDPAGAVLTTLPPRVPDTTVQARRWWNFLVANPLGYLPAGTTAESVEVGLPRRVFVPGAPSWLAGWEGPFFGAMLLLSLAAKALFRLH